MSRSSDEGTLMKGPYETTCQLRETEGLLISTEGESAGEIHQRLTRGKAEILRLGRDRKRAYQVKAETWMCVMYYSVFLYW